MRWREASIKAGIVLLPSYAAAWLTEQMIYVVPTLAAASFFASALQIDEGGSRRVDDDGADDGADDGGAAGGVEGDDTGE